MRKKEEIIFQNDFFSKLINEKILGFLLLFIIQFISCQKPAEAPPKMALASQMGEAMECESWDPDFRTDRNNLNTLCYKVKNPIVLYFWGGYVRDEGSAKSWGHVRNIPWPSKGVVDTQKMSIDLLKDGNYTVKWESTPGNGLRANFTATIQFFHKDFLNASTSKSFHSNSVNMSVSGRGYQTKQFTGKDPGLAANFGAVNLIRFSLENPEGK